MMEVTNKTAIIIAVPVLSKFITSYNKSLVCDHKDKKKSGEKAPTLVAIAMASNSQLQLWRVLEQQKKREKRELSAASSFSWS